MMNLIAGAFGGFLSLVGGLFGHHPAPNNDHMASSTSGWMASTTMDHGRGGMGTTTPGHMGMMGMPGVIGEVASINGTTLTVTGRAGMSATTTYTVDASGAKVFKNQATSTVSSIATGDMVVVSGTVSGTNVTAKTIFDGVLQRMMGMRPGNKGGKPPVNK